MHKTERATFWFSCTKFYSHLGVAARNNSATHLCPRTVSLWDLQEPSFNHSTVNFGSMTCVVRSPTFSTGKVNKFEFLQLCSACREREHQANRTTCPEIKKKRAKRKEISGTRGPLTCLFITASLYISHSGICKESRAMRSFRLIQRTQLLYYCAKVSFHPRRVIHTRDRVYDSI